MRVWECEDMRVTVSVGCVSVRVEGCEGEYEGNCE